MIYNPKEEYDSRFKQLHAENANKFFEDLVTTAKVNVEENHATVAQYRACKEELKKLRKKLTMWKVFRVLMIITLILIPLVILKITPKIRALRGEIDGMDQRSQDLLAQAYAQMAPLNALFTDRDALVLMEKTIPTLMFAPCFSAERESDMVLNYDFSPKSNGEQSALAVLAGSYNENPFLFEKRLIHKMGEAVYHGHLTIRWTETYRGSDGKLHTKTRTQTLHASVTKPKPYYHTQMLLHYCAQGGPELCFSREATHLEQKSEKQIEKYIKQGEKKLKKMTDAAIKENRDFTSMSNTDFEVLFGALDRTNEVQYRTLFTPLAQTNMVALLLAQNGYGDNFDFIKRDRTNTVVTQHSQNREVTLAADGYRSYDFDEIKNSFLAKNAHFFEQVYFDFAPLLAIPIYQERPVHSLHPIPDSAQKYSYKECESLANLANVRAFVHPNTKTQAILKSAYVSSRHSVDEVSVTAFSYDIIPQIDFVPVLGGDGRWHSVPVPWDQYIPLEECTHVFVASSELAEGKTVLSARNDLCMFSE